MRGQLAEWTSICLQYLQTVGNLQSITSKSQVVVSDPYASPRVFFPECDSCIPLERFTSTGLGIDLTSTYGTAVLRYHNGTMIDIARIQGNHEYIRVMTRLSAPLVNEGQLFVNAADQNKQTNDHYLRAFRLLSGKTETEDIRVIGEMLSQFLVPIVKRAGNGVVSTRVVITTPELPNLMESDLRKAAAHGGLELLHSHKHFGAPYDVNAAWVGMGYGTCKHWDDIRSCEAEERQMAPKFALSVSFTRNELIVENLLVWTAHAIRKLETRRFAHLGFAKKHLYRGKSTYWGEIGEKIKEMSDMAGTKVESLIVMGESADERYFLNTLWKTLNDVGLRDIYSGLQTERFNATYIAARGAAELAARWQAETWDCVESYLCHGNWKGGSHQKLELGK